MRNKLLKMFIFVLGFFIATFALAWAISLSFRGQLVENFGPLAIIVIVAIILTIIGWKE